MPKKKFSSRSARIESNFAKSILQYIQGRKYSPMTAGELMSQLAIPKQLHSAFSSALNDLVEQNELVFEQNRYRLKKLKTECTTGTISVHRLKGFGFVKVEGAEKDIFIPKHSVRDAVDGDTVEVEITDITAKGPEGRVIAILKRSHTHLGCTIVEKSNHHFIAFSPLLGAQKAVFVEPPKKEKLKEGDRIICQVLDWNNEESAVDAVLTRRIGHISDPSCDVPAAIEEFELPHEFTLEAIEEAKSFGTRVSAKGRLDLTGHECVTIDPDTAKDYDDAISLTCDERGHYFLGVHIADVASYVKQGSALDREAALHGNSTYFPGTCLPMLPTELSNELCSLKPNVKRLTMSVMVEFDGVGNLVDYKIERTCIKSVKRFSYTEAFAVLQGEKKSPLRPLLERMVELCHLLKHKRFERGSIDFAMPESVVIVDDKGVPLRLERREYDITHQMIEEFMLKANEIVATHLYKIGKELIYRIHEEPNPETFEDFYNYARALGFTLPQKPTHLDIQRLFELSKDSALAPQLSVSFIRSMKLAFYSPDNIGHYGLALDHYCHFTSPIRRYTDLIIQRLLFNEEEKSANLTEIAEECSEKERRSCRAENSVVQLKKLRLAATEFNADPNRIYTGQVTRVKPFALFFEVPDFDLEGSIHVSELGNDFFEYDPKRLAFRGKRSGKTYSCGATLSLRLIQIDLTRQQMKWEIASPKKR
jgi:ribonuclease R